MARLMRPLFRLLLRHGVPFGAFEELARRTYVDVAFADFGIGGKRPSASRVSILSGLSRKEVQRLAHEPLVPESDAGARYNRAARMLTGWVRDRDFCEENGQPRALDPEGDLGFAGLVKRHSGDVPSRAILDELEAIGSHWIVVGDFRRRGIVRKRTHGSLLPATSRVDVMLRQFAPQIEVPGRMAANLIGHGPAPTFQRDRINCGAGPVRALRG